MFVYVSLCVVQYSNFNDKYTQNNCLPMAILTNKHTTFHDIFPAINWSGYYNNPQMLCVFPFILSFFLFFFFFILFHVFIIFFVLFYFYLSLYDCQSLENVNWIGYWIKLYELQLLRIDPNIIWCIKTLTIIQKVSFFLFWSMKWNETLTCSS